MPRAYGLYRAGRARFCISGISRGIPSRHRPDADISTSPAERCCNFFAAYIVTDPAHTSEEKQLLSEKVYRDMRSATEDEFVAAMGAEAVKELLEKIDLESSAKSCIRNWRKQAAKAA